jgi:hypothetical protein
MAYFRKILRASAATTTAKTEVGDWVDVDEYNELYFWLDVTVFAARSDETLIVTIEREANNTAGYTTIETFTTKQTTGVFSEEQTTTSLCGGRIRYRAVTAGTWSSKSITYSIQMAAKDA